VSCFAQLYEILAFPQQMLNGPFSKHFEKWGLILAFYFCQIGKEFAFISLMKKFLPLIFLFIASCSGLGASVQTPVQTYQLGEYSIFIANTDKVNDEYQKICSSSCSRLVKGFVNHRTKEMWSIRSMPVVMRKMKQIIGSRTYKKAAVYK
jgi:hypothetical protein